MLRITQVHDSNHVMNLIQIKQGNWLIWSLWLESCTSCDSSHKVAWFESCVSSDSNHKHKKFHVLLYLAWFESWIVFVSVSSDTQEISIFQFFKIFWDSTSHMNWIDITYGSYFISLGNWLKPSWPNFKHSNCIMHA